MDGPSTTRLDRWSGDFGFGTEDQGIGDLADVDRGPGKAGCAAARGFMLELALDLATRRDRQVVVDDIADDPRACFDYKIIGLDRSFDLARKLGRFGSNLARYDAAFALNDAAAGDIALHLAVDMEVDAGIQVADDFYVGGDNREGVP
jgi:hypothetical protein